jgi:hypothetical protein
MAAEPVPEALICVRCDEQWTIWHTCDLLYGDTLVKVVRAPQATDQNSDE